MSSGSSYCDSAYIAGTMYADYSCSFSETEVSVANNTSKVKWSGYVNYDHSLNYAFSGNTRSEAGYVRVYVNGSIVQSSTAPMDSGMSPGYRIRTLSGTTGAIAHNADGSKTVECYVKIVEGEDPYGGGFVWSDSTGSKDSLKLTTIARASTPSINTWPTSNNTFALGDTITIHMNRASSSFTHDVVFYYGSNNSRSVTVATGVENNCTYNTANIAAQFLADNPNASSLTGKIKVTTKNGSTTIGYKEITYTATIPDSYSPTITLPTDVITETALSSVGVPDKTIIRYISKKAFKVTAAPKNGASIVQVVLKDGSNLRYLSQSGTTTTWTGTFDNLETANISFAATDSRGKITEVALTGLTLIPYVRPTIRNAYLTRVNASTGENSELTAYGIYYNGTIGSVTNKITVKYNLNGGSDQTLPTSAVTYSSNNWNGVALIGTLEPDQSYASKVTVADAFNQTVSIDISIASVHNALWVGKKTVRVHDYLIADSDVWLNDGATKLSSVASAVNTHTNRLVMRNYTWNGTFGEGGSVTKNFRVDGTGIAIFNIYANSQASQDDTGQIAAWVDWTNSSNSTVRKLAWSGNRIGVSASFQNAACAASQLYFDGGTTNNRLKFYASNTKMGTTSWRINITTIGCTVTAV